jgi:hypothetical protein
VQDGASVASGTETAQVAAQAAPAREVVAKAGSYYRNTRYVLVLGLLGYGLLSIHDGFFKWPNENAQAYALDLKNPNLDSSKLPHSDTDILFNKVLGVLLPPASLLLLGWAIFNSRGVIRLKDDTLEAPGRKPIQLTAIESVDKSKWERKGIAWVNYRLDNGKQETLKLDDFVYQREPIDEIFKRIEQSLLNPRPKKVVVAPAAASPVAAAPAKAAPTGGAPGGVKTVTAIPASPRTRVPPPPTKFPPPPPRPRLGGR